MNSARWDPALDALGAVKALVPDAGADESSPFIRRERPTPVFRVSSRHSSRAFAAKPGDPDSSAREANVLMQLFPDFNAVECFGVHVSPTTSQCWLVTAQAHGVEFDPFDSSDRAVLARRISAIHRHFADMPAHLHNLLPREDRLVWRERIETATRTLHRALDNEGLLDHHRLTLNALIDVFDATQETLEDYQAICSKLPLTLVHGDLSASNVVIDRSTSDTRVAIIDWVTAHRGWPAIDLTFLDLDFYRDELGASWPIDPTDLRRLQGFGFLLWIAHVVPGELAGLTSPWPERSMAKIEWYVQEFRERDVA